MSSPSGLIYRYVLQSPDRSPMELKTFEDLDRSSRPISSVPGVADDSGFGGGNMQYQVLLDPAKVAGAGLSVAQVETSLAANNSNAGGGFYSQGGQFYYVRGVGPHRHAEDIGNVVVAVNNGTPVLLKDVGRVEIGIAPRLGEFGYRETERRGGRRHPAAHRRKDPGRAQGRRSQDQGTERTDPAQGRQGRSLL